MTQDHGAIPPLQNGERLSCAELERRYDAMPELKKAELVEGEVYMPSPVRHGRHSHPHTRLVAWLANYETDTPGVEAGDNGSIRLDLDNELQPDAYLIIRPERGGQARISLDDYIEGAPELVIELPRARRLRGPTGGGEKKLKIKWPCGATGSPGSPINSASSTSLMPPRQGVGGGEDQDDDAGHQGAVFFREAAHGDLGAQGLEQQTSGRGAQDAAPAALKRDSAHDARGDRIQLIARRSVRLGDAQP